MSMLRFDDDYMKEFKSLLLTDSNEFNGALQKISIMESLLANPGSSFKRLDSCETAFQCHFEKTANRMVFDEDGNPYVFIKAVYTPGERDNPAHTTITLSAYARGKKIQRCLNITHDMVRKGVTVASLLASYRLTPETELLVEQYQQRLADWDCKRGKVCSQFTYTTDVLPISDEHWSVRRSERAEWTRGMSTYRLVNDMGQVKGEDSPIERIVTERTNDDGDRVEDALGDVRPALLRHVFAEVGEVAVARERNDARGFVVDDVGGSAAVELGDELVVDAVPACGDDLDLDVGVVGVPLVDDLLGHLDGARLVGERLELQVDLLRRLGVAGLSAVGWLGGRVVGRAATGRQAQCKGRETCGKGCASSHHDGDLSSR